MICVFYFYCTLIFRACIHLIFNFFLLVRLLISPFFNRWMELNCTIPPTSSDLFLTRIYFYIVFLISLSFHVSPQFSMLLSALIIYLPLQDASPSLDSGNLDAPSPPDHSGKGGSFSTSPLKIPTTRWFISFILYFFKYICYYFILIYIYVIILYIYISIDLTF